MANPSAHNSHQPVSVSDEKLKRWLIFSGALHLTVMIVMALKSVIAPSEPKAYLPSLRVDLVALPDLKKNDLPVLPDKEESTPAKPKEADPKIDTKPENDGDISLKKKKDSKKEKEAQERLKNAIARIKALDRIKAMQAGAPVKGNQISKGSALSGDAKTSLETTYFDVVLERVRNYWELPKWLQEANYSAQVTIYIDRAGQMTRFEFKKASGNEAFDNEVKRTLQMAVPFPAPPIAIIPDLAQEGILLGFPM